MRKLNDKEMGLSAKSLESMKEQLAYNLYQVEICKLKLDSGLMIEFKKNVRDYKKLKKEFEGEAELLKSKMKILQKQMREGVEEKGEAIKYEEEK